MRVSFRQLLEVTQSIQVMTLVFCDPAFVYFMDGDRVEIMKLLTPSSYRGNQVGVFKPRQMLSNRLTGHIQARTELSECLAVLRAQGIQQAPPGRVSESLEHTIDIHRSLFTQENTCMSRMIVHSERKEHAMNLVETADFLVDAKVSTCAAQKGKVMPAEAMTGREGRR